jgi:hypothetical protein
MISYIVALALAWFPVAPGSNTTMSVAAATIAQSSHRPAAPSVRLNVTAQSCVVLDGRSCRYEEVPANAVVTFAEVASDRTTVLAIHFRSQK